MCCPGANFRKWATPLLTRFGIIRQYNDDLIFFFLKLIINGKTSTNSHINTPQRFFIKRPTFRNIGFGFKTFFPSEINLSQRRYMVGQCYININFSKICRRKTWILKGSFFGRYSIRYNVFDALLLLGIGRIRASVLPDFERHNQKSQKD